MRKTTKVSPEVIERAVRMVEESQPQHEPQWAAIVSGRFIAPDRPSTGEIDPVGREIESSGAYTFWLHLREGLTEVRPGHCGP